MKKKIERIFLQDVDLNVIARFKVNTFLGYGK